MAEALDAGTVFGRVTPQQKRDMVGALQSRGHTVAMTGDGVNDVLALKDADIGVAMGSGSEATRAVAQIVLLNNSFATLPSVVAEGRRVIGNITRVATLFLTKTVYSVLLAILVVCWQVEYPFLPRHLTLLSTLTIGVPAFFLALAPNKERAKPHFVRRVMRYAIPGGVIAAVATFATYLIARHHYSGRGRAGGRDQRGDPDAVPGLDVGAGDHRPPVHLVAGRPGRRDGRVLPGGPGRARGSRTSSR